MPNYRRFPIAPLSGGLRTSVPPSRLRDGETPDALNVEFVDDSIKSVRGSRKLNNQTLPRPSLLCRPDPAYSPLFIEAGKSAPLRGYVYRPYDPDTDIGGDFANTGTFVSPNYNTRRGRSFERQVSIRLPETFLMHDRPARGEGAPNPGNAAIEAGCGYDEGLDDCTIIMQKGGDRNVPMSWALGIVNAGNHAYNVGLGTPLARKSNYFLVFMWLDSPEWAPGAIMRYSLSNPSVVDAFATESLRAFILDGRNDTVAYALEPGKSYNISISIALDTASVLGGSWNNDGRVDIRVQEEHGRLWTGSFVDSGGGGTTTNLSAYKGPADSLRYLAKYGVRYSSRDAEHYGLGYRLAPWNAQGFIPYGMDSAAMEHKGFRMADCSLNSIADLYGGGAYTLVCSHAVGANAYVTVNTNRALTTNNTNFKQQPVGRLGSGWGGYGDATLAAPATNFNPDALRGYRLVFPRSTVTGFQGGCFNIQNYVEQSGVEFRLFLQDVGSTATTWTDQPFLIRAFRWNQQALYIQEVRGWKTSRDYANTRVQWSMAHSLALDDETEPELSKLEFYLPLDDGGGRVCRELVRARHAYLAPYGLGVSDTGQEGRNALFLSGEGEALVYDLSENPVFVREMKALLESNSKGFAIELSCIIPEAYYGVAILNSTNRAAQYEAAFCPDIVSWAVKEADDAGGPTTALPLLTMGHHSWWPQATGTSPERSPQGFHLDISTGLDSEAKSMTTAVLGYTRDTVGAGNWDDSTPWVGKRITIQVGIQPSPDNRNIVANKENEFRVYIAATPKGALKFLAGENPQAEFAYFSDFLIQRKQLPRLVVTIGGGWNPTMMRGYTEYSARMIVDKVRVYGATAAGDLPTATGLVTSDRRGKIMGRNSLPQRELGIDDILQPLGPGTRTADFREEDPTVRAPGGTAFYTQRPEQTFESLRERYIVPIADKFEKPVRDGLPETIQEFYWVSAVAADGTTASLATPYNGPRSPRAAAGSTNLVGYTTFEESALDLVRSPLTLGAGQAYRPGLTTTAELALSGELFADRSVIGGKWKVRVASPFTEGGLATVLPRWSRGIVSPRRGSVTGLQALDDAVFATNRGTIAKMDDRWREDGPTTTLRTSLAFHGRELQGFETRAPLVVDGLRISSYSNAWPYWSTGIFRNFTWVYDAWVWIESYAELQTILWLGCEYSHLLLGPAATNERRGIGVWLRLANGRPELVRESSGNFLGGATPPPDGRYVATAADRVPLRTWTHLRWYLNHVQSGGIDVLQVPGIKMNGRTSRVSVNAFETGLSASTDWIQANNNGGLIGTIDDARNVLYLGVGRDAVRTYAKSQFTTLSQLGGREYPGSRLAGRLHPLLGRLSGVVSWRAASGDPLVSGYPDFDPYTLDYTGRSVRMRLDLQDGIGEHVAHTATDTAGGSATVTPGVVLSHPAIDLYNEFGGSDQLPSFAVSQQRVYAANGGRPAFVTESAGGPAGILPPNTKPSVAVERKPVWTPNIAPIESSSPEQDPIIGENIHGGASIFHYDTHGNAYLHQRWHEDMRWVGPISDPTATAFDVFGLKFYWKPRDVTGRRQLYAARGSIDSGGIFLECEDGKARVGWFDTVQKRRVWAETSVPVFRPGYWYYVYLRKSVPQLRAARSGLPFDPEGRWLNSYNVNGRRRSTEIEMSALVPSSFQVGDIIRVGASGPPRGLVVKAWSYRLVAGSFRQHIDYVLFTGDADFTAPIVVNDGAGKTGTIVLAPTATIGDSLVIREFSKTAALGETVLWGVKAGAHRSSVSFTSGLPRPTNTTAIGPVTPKATLFSGAAAGVVNVATMLGVAAPIPCFHADMVGMQWQFASTVPTAFEKVYRIQAVNSVTQIVVVDEHGANPNLSAITNREGAVFSGVDLLRSDGFDTSDAPDQANYDTEFMGGALTSDPLNGIYGSDGEFASFGWVVAAAAGTLLRNYGAVGLFESATPTEPAERGTDSFPVTIFNQTSELSTSRPGELRFDAGFAFTVVDGQPYGGALPASTQPNGALEVRQDAEADADAESLFWRFVKDRESVSGRRHIFVAFYDVNQDVLSNPGPSLTVEVAGEDQANPGGMAQLILTNLPISHQPGQIDRYVYMTAADDIVPFLAAIVEGNLATSVALRLDRDLDLDDVLPTDNAPPPDCSVIGVSQAVMFFGDIRIGNTRRRDVLFFSKPFLPLQVPYANTLFLISGSNERITAMADLNGVLLVWKKDALIEVVVRDGIAFQQGKSSNVGCVGPQAASILDQDAWWVSNDRGLYLYSGSGGPVWIGENVSDFFDEDGVLRVDPQAMERCVLGVNRRQSQIAFLWKERLERDMRRRFAVEFDTGLTELGVRRDPASSAHYAMMSGPNVTTLGAADRLVPATQRLMAGTAEGFVVQLDRVGTQLELHEPGLAVTATIGVGSTATRLVLTGALTGVLDLESLRGVPVAWDGGSATILFTEGTNLHLDRSLTSIPAQGTVVSIGAIPLSWTSKVFDFGNMEEAKIPEYLDLETRPQASGEAVVEAFVDSGSTPQQLRVDGVNGPTATLDLTQALHRIPLNEVRGQLIQFRIRTTAGAVGVALEVIQATVRLIDGELH